MAHAEAWRREVVRCFQFSIHTRLPVGITVGAIWTNGVLPVDAGQVSAGQIDTGQIGSIKVDTG
jgi:hypothetical protein